jgi:hypothetical protein
MDLIVKTERSIQAKVKEQALGFRHLFYWIATLKANDRGMMPT